ncbi:MAG TPA: hypothetical protein VEK07_12115 [Polyangiaceae bacterium]|nr:hypothetical protein [Polyangiaceae bacterium]
MIGRSFALFLLAAGCTRTGAPEVAPLPSGSASAALPATTPSTGAREDASPAALAATSDSAGPDAAPNERAAVESAIDASGVDGVDFIGDARIIFSIGACGAPADVPPGFDAATVAKHCEELQHAYEEYKRTWLSVAEPFLAALRPKDLPPIAVYPFGGGDLMAALATFPDATEITTISLEPAGDVRPVEGLRPERFAQELAAHRAHLERLLEKAHSRTDNLEKESKTEIPGEILFALAALVVHGDVPISLRYFRIRPDGTIAYVTQADIDEQAHHPKAQRALFENAELRFRSASGSGSSGRVLRHIAFNLDDDHLRADPRLLVHLSSKGKVSAMTKAASHLLWNDHFALIRGWLVDHTDWMVSDSTGIPPRFAQAAGFSQETYGKFDGPAPFGLFDSRDANDFKHLFATEPERELAFRYGYPDKDGHAHLIVTKRETPDASP